MKKWKQKAIVQKTISYLPFGQNINYFFQKYVTKGENLNDEYFLDRLGHAKEHIHYYQKFTGNSFPNSSLEIGTGWYPVVPISLFLIGSETIYSVDIKMLTSKERIVTTLRKFVECYELGELNKFLDYKSERFEVIHSILSDLEKYDLSQILQLLKITYLIEDARKLSLADNSIDLVNSNNTFEHIYPEILIPILKEFKRIVKKPNGVMSHFIDMSDHFAHFDKSINIYNFLQFSDKQWKWIDNSIQPQSRIRIYDYKKIYQDLNIPISELTFREGNINELKSVTLDSSFSNKTLEEVAISHCHFVSDMKGNNVSV
jgi:ubiquinone/menaquinone biosynthesis C-methylase UbiE